MIEGELDAYLGYDKHSRSEEIISRNGRTFKWSDEIKLILKFKFLEAVRGAILSLFLSERIL